MEENEKIILDCFEKSVVELFEFFFENSKKITSVFVVEYETQAFLFMKLFNYLEKNNLLFNKNGYLLFGINRRIIIEEEEIIEKIKDGSLELEFLKTIFNFFEKDKKIKEEIENKSELKNDKEKNYFWTILKKIKNFKSVDISIIKTNENLLNEKKYFIYPEKYLLACEIKDSSAGYYPSLWLIKKDIIKLNLLKITGRCENACMIFIDTIPTDKMPKREDNIFNIKNGKLVFNDSMKHLFEKIKMYYLYIPEDLEKNQEELARKDIGNISVFSLKRFLENDFSLVENLDDIKKNIIQFNSDLKTNKELVETLSQFSHWYYIDGVGFGPSKYIGYKNQNVEKYMKFKQIDDGMDGRETEPHLKKLGLFVETKDEKIKIDLRNFLLLHGKKPNKRSRIYVLKV
ncbi:MAG: hypothetical protein QW350_00690 [Candidatus Aenigmatarchaeota archaeon]